MICLGYVFLNSHHDQSTCTPSFPCTYITKLTRRLWSLSLASSTRRSYATGLRAFKRFLYLNRITRPFNQCFDEQTLQYFISYCIGVLHICSNSIRSYLAGIRYYCLATGRPDPLCHSNGDKKFSFRVLLKAAEKVQHQPRHYRLPILNTLLFRICKQLNGSFFGIYWDSLLRASLCTAFYGFLRPGEFTTVNFDASRNLTLSDLNFSWNRAVLLLKRSKTDRCNRGVYIPYYRTNNNLCPIRQLRTYLKYRSQLFYHLSPNATPLFITPSGRALSPQEFVKHLRHVLSSLGVDPSRYSGHSIRIGAASTAAKAGIPVYLIKILGRWSSEAYRRYISVSSSTISNAFFLLSAVHSK